MFFPFIYTFIAVFCCKYKWADAKPEGMDMNTWFTLIIPAIILVIFFGWHLVYAPYEIYKEHFQKLCDVESKLDQFYHQTKPLPEP